MNVINHIYVISCRVLQWGKCNNLVPELCSVIMNFNKSRIKNKILKSNALTDFTRAEINIKAVMFDLLSRIIPEQCKIKSYTILYPMSIHSNRDL